MDRRIVLPAMALALVAIGLGIVGSVGSAAPSFAANGAKPTFHVVLSTVTAHVGGMVDTFLYLTNPSHNMETFGTPIQTRQLVHAAVVNSLTCEVLYPDGTTETPTFDPSDPNGMFAWRWDPVVNPLERSLVFFLGWSVGGNAGVVRFKYTLTVTFEGQTSDLVETFRVVVRP